MANITNPIKYASRTFQSILNDINSDSELISKPSWWKKLWAGIGDVLSIWLNSMVNLMFLRTSYTRQSVSDLGELIDYYLSPHTTSMGKLIFHCRSDLGGGIFPFTILPVDLIARSSGGLNTSSKQFEGRVQIIVNPTDAIFTANASTDEITWAITDDYKYTGHKFQVYVSGVGSLPGGLFTNTDYYGIYNPSTGGLKVALSASDAFSNNYIDITSTGSGILKIKYYSFITTVYQQETLEDQVVIGDSDGVTEWQEFELTNSFVLKDTLKIYLNGSILWTRVDSFIDSISTSMHYKLIPLSGNRFKIRFGNGTRGMIPPAFPVSAEYSYGGGINSNIKTLGSISSYSGGEDNIVGVTNPETMSGGSDEESIDSAKKIAPILLKARSRFVEEEDGEALAMQYGGLSYVRLFPNYYGPLTCMLYGIANEGGNPSLALRNSICAYLKSKSIMDSTDVFFDAATFIPISIEAYVKLKAGYVLTGGIYKYIDIAFKMFLTENGHKIKSLYASNGISETTLYINTIFSTTFTEDDYAQLSKLIENLTPAVFGGEIQLSNMLSYIDSYVDGVDYLNTPIISGGFPVYLDPNEITTPGTITIQEIL